MSKLNRIIMLERRDHEPSTRQTPNQQGRQSAITNRSRIMPLLLCPLGYTVARALGMRAKLGLGHVSLSPDNQYSWKMFVVMLAPALAGVVGLVFLVGLSIMRQRPLAIWVSLFLAVYWWLMCLDDFYSLWYYSKHKKWPKSAQGKPKSGLAGIKVLAEWRPWEEDTGQTKIRQSGSKSNSLIKLLEEKHNER